MNGLVGGRRGFPAVLLKSDPPIVKFQFPWRLPMAFNKISPEAVGLEIDVSDAPHTWNICTVNKDGDLVDLFDPPNDSDGAHALARKLAQDSGLPLKIRYSPFEPSEEYGS
jgi:hypothetical protein